MMNCFIMITAILKDPSSASRESGPHPSTRPRDSHRHHCNVESRAIFLCRHRSPTHSTTHSTTSTLFSPWSYSSMVARFQTGEGGREKGAKETRGQKRRQSSQPKSTSQLGTVTRPSSAPGRCQPHDRSRGLMSWPSRKRWFWLFQVLYTLTFCSLCRMVTVCGGNK